MDKRTLDVLQFGAKQVAISFNIATSGVEYRSIYITHRIHSLRKPAPCFRSWVGRRPPTAKIGPWAKKNQDNRDEESQFPATALARYLIYHSGKKIEGRILCAARGCNLTG
jgi:hypothetical protein